MNRIRFDELMNTYGNEFYIEPEFYKDFNGHGWLIFNFYDIKNNNVSYFSLDSRWHPKKGEIEYDESMFERELCWARQKMRRNRMRRKMYRIKKDF